MAGQPTSAPAQPSSERTVAPALVKEALRAEDAHSRQRDLVRLSLLACPGAVDPTHRRGD